MDLKTGKQDPNLYVYNVHTEQPILNDYTDVYSSKVVVLHLYNDYVQKAVSTTTEEIFNLPASD